MTYDEALAVVLEIPTLEREASGATRVVRCLVKPSFHPECSISIVERDLTAEVVVRAPSRRVWSLVLARKGTPAGDPVRDWLKPAVSTERLMMTAEAAAAWRSTIDEIERAPSLDRRERPTLVLDGMSANVELWRSGTTRSFTTRFAPLDETAPQQRLVRVILDSALGVAQWDQSLAALRAARGYLDG